MKIYYGIENYPDSGATAVTTGTFDGVHQGHLSILNRLVRLGKRDALHTVLVTFDPHPRKVIFGGQKDLRLLSTLDEKLDLLSKTGIDSVVVHPFTKEFSRTTAQSYVHDLLMQRLHMQTMVVGYDHQFGKNRQGSIEHLREFAMLYGFNVEEIPAKEVDHVNVSSSKARKALEDGAVELAALFLGHPYFLSARVVAGHQRGQSLGFPTANLEIDDPEKLIPADGVFAVRTEIGHEQHRGMLSIGTNPTFGSNNPRTIELNIFDFNEMIYGQKIKVHFIAEIRKPHRFESSEALVSQLYEDRNMAIKKLIV